jgi:hypothetical protein
MGKEVYPYKGSLVAYYQLNAHSSPGAFSTSRVASMDYTAGESVIEHIDPTTAQNADKKTGLLPDHFRIHRTIPPLVDQNKVIIALQAFMMRCMLPVSWQCKTSDKIETVLDYSAMMQAQRVTKEGAGRNFFGEPGPEGIHQDAAALTAIILIDRQNVSLDSGQNRVWSIEQPAGKPSDADLTSARLLSTGTLMSPFDALIVLDREVKHEACPIIQDVPRLPAVRDVLTFEVRRKHEQKD